MAHNALIRGGPSSGAWSAYLVTGADLELFDLRQFQSLNADLGGVWAPAAVCEIGGSGFKFTGLLETSGLVNLDGTVTLPNGFTVTGTNTVIFESSNISIGDGGEFTAFCASHFNGDVTVGADANVTMTAGGGVLSCGKAASFSATLAVAGAVTFATTLAVTGVATFTGKPVFSDGFTVGAGTHTVDFNNSTTNIGGALNLSANTSLQGAGNLSFRYVAVGDADHTYSISDGDLFYVGAQSADHFIKFSTTAARAGHMVKVSALGMSGGHTHAVKNNAGTVLCTLSNAVGNIIFAELWFNGSDWVLANYSTLA